MADDALASRRTLLKGVLAAVGGWMVAGVLAPLRALAAEWSKPAFEAHKVEEALQNLFGTAQATPSASIRIIAPQQAENGATVRFEVSTTLPNTSTIAVLVEKNERPLVLAMHVNGAQPFVSLRMKMAQSSDVHAIVKSQGKLYSAKQNIKVTIGGCGG
jgi:sulfur-oxidizing protein SoxY